MERLFAERAALRADEPALATAEARHLKVLRAKPGERLELFDGAGAVRVYEMRTDGRLHAAGPLEIRPAPAAFLSLYACVAKGSRWDWTVEKAVELGVSRIVPVISARTIVRLDGGAERAAKAERWRRVAADAARQSHAVWIPAVEEPLDFNDALADATASGAALFGGFLTDPPPPPLLEAWNARVSANGAPAKAAVFIGPEGDFTANEISAMQSAGVRGVSLGPTVLRTETAAIYACSVLAAAAARDAFEASKRQG